MGEEIKRRGRQKGDVKQRGYIVINDNLRIRVETDCLIWEEKTGKDSNNDDIWGNNKYFTSWNGVLDCIIRRFTTDKISQKGVISFIEGRDIIVSTINEVKKILIGELDNQMKNSNDEIKKAIRKFS